MKVLEALRAALDGIAAHPLRSALTSLGLAIGVGATMLVVACLRGFDTWIVEKLARIGPDVFVLVERDPGRPGAERPLRLRRADADALARRLAQVAAAGAEARTRAVAVAAGRDTGPVEVRGVGAAVSGLGEVPVAQGRGITEGEEALGAAVCVLGRDVAERLFAGVDPIGQSLRLGSAGFRVVGVFSRLGSAFGYSLDGFVQVPLSTFRSAFGDTPATRIHVRGRPGADLDALAAAAREVLCVRHGLAAGARDGLEVQTVAGARAAFDSITSRLVPAALFAVGVALGVGALVVMNILLVSVAQRTREVGVRKAVGASDRDIALQFLLEALLLSLAGGLAGIVVGQVACAFAGGVLPYAVQAPADAPWLPAGISAAVAAAAGTYPALRAGRLPVVDALGVGRT